MPDSYLESGMSAESARKPRQNEMARREASLELLYSGWKKLQSNHAGAVRSDNFETRLVAALRMRGLISGRSPSHEEVLEAAQYLLSWRFKLEWDEDGDITPPSGEEIVSLADRCGVEAEWLLVGSASEHSYIRARTSLEERLI